MDCNLETTRGGTPGNNNEPGSPNNGDGSVLDRPPYDSSDNEHVLPVALNDDDDNEDVQMTPDREETGPVLDEDDLVELRFQFTQGLIELHNDPKKPEKGTVTVRVAGTAPDAEGKHPRLKIWKNQLKGADQEIVLEWDGSWYKREYDLNTDWDAFVADLLETPLRDSDRDGGFPEQYDDELAEDTFNDERGAVVLTNSNSDRTDGTDKDNQDDKINEPTDVIDTSHLVVRRPGIAAIPSGLRSILRIPDSQATHFRIFDSRNEGEDEFLGPAQGQADGAGHKQAVMPNEWIAAPEHESTWTFGVESIHYLREEYAQGEFNTEGKIETELVYQLSSDGGQTWRDWASDKARLQDCAEFTSTYRQSTPTTRWRLPTIVDLKDTTLSGPVEWPDELRQSEDQYGYVIADNNGEGGNVDVTPPLPGYPLAARGGGIAGRMCRRAASPSTCEGTVTTRTTMSPM